MLPSPLNITPAMRTILDYQMEQAKYRQDRKCCHRSSPARKYFTSMIKRCEEAIAILQTTNNADAAYQHFLGILR